jgi:hypothetical protein
MIFFISLPNSLSLSHSHSLPPLVNDKSQRTKLTDNFGYFFRCSICGEREKNAFDVLWTYKIHGADKKSSIVV